jgi:hypothetical protein
MKKYLLIFALLFLVSSCKKYPEGPYISLARVQYLIQNVTWRVSSYQFLEDNVLRPTPGPDDTCRFLNNTSFTGNAAPYLNFDGLWSNYKDWGEIEIFKGGHIAFTFHIERLTGDEFWLQNDSLKIEMVGK